MQPAMCVTAPIYDQLLQVCLSKLHEFKFPSTDSGSYDKCFLAVRSVFRLGNNLLHPKLTC